MTTKKLNIVIIDSHQLMAQSLSDLLYTNYNFVESIYIYKDPQHYFDTKGKEPDIVISEIAIPGMNSIDLLRQYKQGLTRAKLIILTSITEVQTIRYSLSQGAMGYLGKNSSYDELINAICSVSKGEKYISENLRNSLMLVTLVEEHHIYHLSQREKEVLKFICEGKTIKEVAAEMKLSVNTVQTYYRAILKKFKLRRTGSLIVFAIQHGLYNPHRKK